MLTKSTLNQIKTIVSSAVDAMEKRITKNVIAAVQPSQQAPLPLVMRIVPPEQVPPTYNTAPPGKLYFKDVLPGNVFRLDAGSQPMMKLEDRYAEMPYQANAFYLKTGSAKAVRSDAIVVPLRMTMNITE